MGFEKLNKAISQAEVASAKRLKREIEWQASDALKQKEYLDAENVLLGAKLALSGRIFAWGKNFLQSETYRRLRRINKDSDIELYAGGWGHKNVEGDCFGCWSRIRVGDDGAIEYLHGYKWHGASSTTFRNQQELAKGLNFAYLTKLAKHLHSKGVVDFIARDLKDLARDGL
ncbi:MAG: hypothetical protein KGH59_00195 [Candidatus Micrarchaeota archaeon]|nr:hypothetical protein [Candidatus Micrarchaeota archaeon]MDE1804194.1 hypothetical protein [Candidatus Micrarchaeota archaeon]MDE1846698.1 hypothetical protein [Candidatus Micrarchaeota archaeon]